MNSEALLALISELYQQLAQTQIENQELKERLAKLSHSKKEAGYDKQTVS